MCFRVFLCSLFLCLPNILLFLLINEWKNRLIEMQTDGYLEQGHLREEGYAEKYKYTQKK